MRGCGLVVVAVLAIGCRFDTSVGGNPMTLGGDGSSSVGSETDGESSSGTIPSTTSAATSSTTSGGGTTLAGEGSSSGDPSQGTFASSSGEDQLCADLLWVIGDADIASTRDAPYYEAVVDLGYEVELVSGLEASAAMADGKCAVLLSSVGTSNDVNTKFLGVEVPVIVWEHALLDDMGMVVTATTQGTIAGDSIDIVDPAHPLAAGLSGTVAIQSAIDHVGWGVAGASVVATVTNVPTYATIFYYEAGDTMPSTIVAPARRVALPFANEATAVPTKAAVDLFVAAVQWSTAS